MNYEKQLYKDLIRFLFTVITFIIFFLTNNSQCQTTSGSFINSLTAEERNWLADHKVIRVALDPDWPPVEFVNESGQQSGMSLDYLKLVEQRLNIKFKRIENLKWSEAYSKLRRWEIDMTTSVTETPQRKKFWAFTKPYLNIPIVIATQADVTYISDIKELADKKIALVKDFALEEWISKDYPEFELVKVNTAIEGLEKVQRGEAFAYLDNFLIIGYYQAKIKAADIKIAGLTTYANTPCMAVRKDWAIFAVILQKALDSISERERTAIYRKWLPQRYEYGFDYKLLMQIAIVLTLIIIALAVWNRKLAKEIRSRKKAEDALRQSEKKYHDLVENALVGVFIADQHGRLQYLNEAAKQLFEYDSIEEMYGQNVSAMLKNPDEKRPLLEILNKEGKITDLEIEGLTKRGRDIVFILNASYDDGHITGLVLDVTLKKQMVDELIVAKEKAEEMNKVKSVFFENMSHELRTPFVGILGFAEIIEDSSDDKDVKELASGIIESARRMISTMNNLLELSKLVVGEPIVNFELTNAEEIIKEVYNLFKEQSHTKGVQFEKTVIGLSEPIFLDASLLRGILTNLISNALNYTNKGKVEIIAERQSRDDHDVMIIKVIDTGIGIAKEKQDLIWEEFRQESEGLNRNYEGTGLGLTLTKKYVEMCNGKITVESEVNVGSTFTIEIPIKTSPANTLQ